MEKTEREPSVEVVDREEGEIIDVETYNTDLLELESISSDEEENLRERIRELEAKNAELAKLAMVAKEERRNFNYGDDVWSISSSEEEYYQYQPKMSKFEPKIHQNHRKNIRSGRPVKRFNNRYRSPPKFRPLSPSPEFKRRRRSASPVRRERIRQTGWFNNKKDQKRYSTKKKRRRNRSDSESVDGKLIKAQLNHALQRSNQPRKNHNSLMRKLRLAPEVANNKENENIVPNGIKEEASSDEELIALRLNALKSKREVKEIIQENQAEHLSATIHTITHQNGHKNDDYDTEEMELRLLALKSAIVKKAENRKKHRQAEAYSPTDGLTTILPPEPPDSEMMDISPIASPILDDAILQPIDMDIATPEDSNSPAFFVSFDDAPNNQILPIQPVEQTAHFHANPVLIPIIPKVTSNGIPLGIMNRSIQDELREKRASTRSPSNLILLTNNRTDRRSKSLDGLKITDEQKIEEDEDDEEEALRSLLLSKLNSTTPKVQTKNIGLVKEKSYPMIMKSELKRSTESSDITDITVNLKKAAKRIKDLSDQENQFINFELDRIIWKPATPEPLSKELNDDENQKCNTLISLKEVVERFKHAKEVKEKLNEASILQASSVSNVTTDGVEDVSDMHSENTAEPEINDTKISKEKQIITESKQEIEKSTVRIAETISNQISNQSDDKKASLEHDLRINAIKSDDVIAKMEPKKIVNAMSAIAQSLQPKPQPSVLKPKLAPIIMKRKKKTKSSIINVPFQKQAFPTKTLPKTDPAMPSSSSMPTTSNLITSLESVIKPIPKVVIQLGQSSTEDDSDSSDDNNEEDDDDSNLPSRSRIASPSHITELGDIMIDSPKSITTNNSEQNGGLTKVDSTFELRLDQFLKQARAKTEQEQEIMQKKSGEKALKGVSVQGASSAVKYLNPSAQIEYKKLQLKIKMLEKQKQARLQSNGNIQITVKNDLAEENLTPPRQISGTTAIVVTPVCPTPKILSFEEKVLKLSEEQKERLLQKAETNLTEYSTKFLNDLSDYIVTIEDATIEKKKQKEMEKEVEELKAKLAVLEPKLTNQKTKLTKIYPMVSNKHKKLLQSRDRYLKLSRSCTKIGQSVKEDYQFKTDAQKQIFEKLKTLPSKAKQLKNCGDSIDTNTETINNQEDTQNPTNMYKSVLDCINSNEGTNTDGVVCPFQLAGKCSDPECKFIHLP